jgi:DNA-binding PadR family transcriptional regulator
VSSLIDYAVLGLLIEQPGDGAELYERFDRRFGAFLPASQATVQDALMRLKREGCVASRTVCDDGADGKPHRVADRGTAR